MLRIKGFYFQRAFWSEGKDITWGPQIFHHIKGNETERINFYLLRLKKVRNTNFFENY